MIMEYEQALAKYIHEAEPRLTEFQFSLQWNTMYELKKSVKYPVCLIERVFDPQTLLMKSYDVEDVDAVHKFWVATMNYKIKIWWERADDTARYILAMRSRLEDHPYVVPIIEGKPCPIGMRAASIAMVEEKDGDDRQGARRCVETVYQTCLPLEKSEEVVLIQKIIINLNNETIKIIE